MKVDVDETMENLNERSGSHIPKRFCRNLKSYFTSTNNLCTADTSVGRSILIFASDFL